ncbi:acyl-CoA synthetase [Arenibaculum sp.]|uniref:acyl-CoA synthetase n=1 Tax=Arenibaculum sp. TaxID=2865862 RepID=UPI002E0DB609|nr:acyl-CoA synthetase [Arenibaculum sp.]
MLTPAASYDELTRRFAWRVPGRYNIGVDACDRHAADPDRVALVFEGEDGAVRKYTFLELMRLSNRLANVLDAQGVRRGDRLAVLLPQAPETAVAHLAGFKAGLITVPLFTLFGEEALEYRLADSGARALVTDAAGAARIAAIRDRLPDLRTVLCIDGAPAGTRDFHTLLDAASDAFRPVDTAADDPAVIIYTSGTTGNPKGALHAHRVLLGHLPGVEMPHEFFPQPGDLFWTPADWAWIGGLFDVLMPAWHHGAPVLAHRFRKFDPERAADLMARHGVRNTFLPPTALKLMRQADIGHPGLRLRSIGSGGETLGGELLDWGRRVFGLTINEFYGQTECNLVVANCAGLMEVRPGSMGRPVPGHEVAVVDPEGNPLPVGETGAIAVRRPDPVMFLGYWNRPEATAEKFAGDWLLTGDLGRRDEDGYLWYVGRDDDVITSAGYRIGPGEIEECLMRHPAVALAGVVGVPDPIRTERVKAFVVLRPGRSGDEALAREIQDFVKTRLAAHEYPREVEFVDELPMTATGKIMRRALRARSGG